MSVYVNNLLVIMEPDVSHSSKLYTPSRCNSTVILSNLQIQRTGLSKKERELGYNYCSNAVLVLNFG